MMRALLAILVTSAAHAETRLVEYGPGVEPRPAQQLVEAACDLDVELRGAVATAELRQRLANRGGAQALGASYELDLPASATITGFATRGDGALERALPIRGAFATADADDRPMLGVDPAILVARPEGASSPYAIRVQPIAADHEVTLVTRFTMLADVRGGALRLVLPGRSTIGLGVCRGRIHATGGPGATIDHVRIEGVTTRGGSATFVVDNKPTTIDAALAFTGQAPIAWTQSQPLVDGWTATVLAVAAPHVRATTGPKRALFVIDGSRSMELVGRQHVTSVVRAITGALPATTTVEAVVFDREAQRVFGAWRPGGTEAVAGIEKALAARAAINGSDLAQALAVARAAIDDGGRETTLVVMISDGVIGGTDGRELVAALGGKTSTLDVLGVVLDPATTRSSGTDALRSPISVYGGTLVELDAADLGDALDAVDGWLRPSWIDLAMPGDIAIPSSLRSGSGFVRTIVHRGSPAQFVLSGNGATKLRLVPRPAAKVAVATLALANDEATLPVDKRARALAAHPYAHGQLAFAVLTAAGKVAKARTAMVKAGGPYERILAVDDPDEPFPQPPVQRVASAISRDTLQRLFREQLQPKAYACYQRALPTRPSLAGTVHFTFHLGRGEVSDVGIIGIGDPALDACLLDAAYALSVPFPDFSVNADDLTIARYPLTFQVANSKPIIVLGDADSSSPLDIDGIAGGVPGRKIRVEAETPLGTLRPGVP